MRSAPEQDKIPDHRAHSSTAEFHRPKAARARSLSEGRYFAGRDAYEAAREKVRRFLTASSVRELILVRSATKGVNLAAPLCVRWVFSSWKPQYQRTGSRNQSRV
jgi:selenocysteine lyase/cysteine desulfurase